MATSEEHVEDQMLDDQENLDGDVSTECLRIDERHPGYTQAWVNSSALIWCRVSSSGVLLERCRTCRYCAPPHVAQARQLAHGVRDSRTPIERGQRRFVPSYPLPLVGDDRPLGTGTEPRSDDCRHGVQTTPKRS